MTTVCKPIVYDQAAIDANLISVEDTNLTGALWERMFRRNSGVDSGFVMTMDNATNEGILSAGWGNWRGFNLEITSAGGGHRVSLPPAPSSAVRTYVVGVLFDPAKYSTAAGPLSIVAGVKGSITIPTNGVLHTLYEVDRTQSVALTNAPVRNYVVTRSGSGLFLGPGVLAPPAAEYPYGTILWDAAGVPRYRDSSSAWRTMIQPMADRVVQGVTFDSNGIGVGEFSPEIPFAPLGAIVTPVLGPDPILVTRATAAPSLNSQQIRLRAWRLTPSVAPLSGGVTAINVHVWGA